MNSKQKYLPINWKDGMAFSQAHLSNQYLSVLDSIRDAAALHLTNYNYGLLGGDSHKRFSDSFRDNINNEKVEISFCRAITQNGSRIEILNQKWEELNKPLSELAADKNLESSNFWYILLGVAPFERIPEGIEDEAESPRRKPYTRPLYAIEMVSQKELELDGLANAIPVAKYELTGSGLKKVSNYIPPSARINSHEQLILRYESQDSYLNQIKAYAREIIKKVKHKKRNNEQNHLADDIAALCQAYIDHFMQSYDAFRLSLKEQPPIKLVEYFATFARVLSHTLDMSNDKDHLLQYFHQYATDRSVSQLSRTIYDVFESKYEHFDIANSLDVIDRFLHLLHEVFQRLVELDYRELAPKNMVRNTMISSGQVERDTRRSGRSIIKKIKHSGKEEYLGDDLYD